MKIHLVCIHNGFRYSVHTQQPSVFRDPVIFLGTKEINQLKTEMAVGSDFSTQIRGTPTRLLFLAVLCSTIQGSSSLRILLFPALGGGHVNNFEGLAEELAKQGHQVFTLFTETKLAKLPKSMKEGPNRTVVYYEAGDLTDEALDLEKLSYTMLAGGDLSELVGQMTAVFEALCHRLTMDSENVIKQLESFKLDAVVVDGHFTMRCAYLLPHRLKLPVVSIVDVIEPWLMRLPYLPSYVPFIFLPFSDQMTFSERLLNLATYIGFYFFPMAPEVPQDILKEYSRYGEVSSTDELARKTLLWLHTSDPALEIPKPSMPNMISVGGLSVKEPQTLSDEYLAKLENSPHGVILVSFGSNIGAIPEKLAKTFLAAFAQVKETVIWRFTNTHNAQIPGNVVISDWIPQKDLLAHPKIKLFVTHCGNGGQHEALHHGVPMVGFPIYGDQPYNAARMAHKGYGLKMDIRNFTAEELVKSMRTVLDSPQFTKRAQKASEIMRNRLQKPCKSAVYWIEHFLKYGNYMHSHSLDMPLYQFLMFDLLALVLIAIVCVAIVVVVILMICCHICRRAKKSKQD